MANFVYDSTGLPTGKKDLAPLPDGVDPNKYLVALDWEKAMQALYDLRGAVKQAHFLGFASQASDPEPNGVEEYFWVRDDGTMVVRADGLSVDGKLEAKTGGVESVVSLQDAANIATDASLSNVFEVTLEGNRTLENPTELSPGFTYIWIIRQDATGGRELSFGSAFQFPDGADSDVGQDPEAVTVVSAICDADGQTLRCGIMKY